MAEIQVLHEGVVSAVLAAKGLTGLDDLVDEPAGSQPVAAVTIEAIESVLAELDLVFPPALIGSVHAALISGKHLLLMGPPGAGKTSLAEAVAEAAQRAGVCSGFIPTTGSSDWTATDTVGGYWMSKGQVLEFVPGQILEAIADSRWVVLDEINRADIDRAIGPLFTVLSGKSTVLRFETTRDGFTGKVAILASGAPVPPGTVPYVVPDSWRIVATMNSQDRDMLFEISQAFMRRLAVIHVAPPPAADHLRILSQFGTGVDAIDHRIQSLTSIPGLPLGPAITIDCARYARSRWQASIDRGEEFVAADIVAEAVSMFVDPQMGGLMGSTRADAREFLLRVVADGAVTVPQDGLRDVFDDDSAGPDEGTILQQTSDDSLGSGSH